jgi:hypothetical protein
MAYWYAISGMVDLDLGDLTKVQHRAEEALKIAQKIHQHGEGWAWILMGRTLGKADQSQDDKGEECLLRGIKFFEELKLKPITLPRISSWASFMPTPSKKTRPLKP